MAHWHCVVRARVQLYSILRYSTVLFERRVVVNAPGARETTVLLYTWKQSTCWLPNFCLYSVRQKNRCTHAVTDDVTDFCTRS